MHLSASNEYHPNLKPISVVFQVSNRTALCELNFRLLNGLKTEQSIRQPL